jgi:electron transport complex protein RnfG
MSKESNLKNMLLCLFVIASVTSALLCVVYLITYEPIEESKRNKVNAAIALVVPAFDNNPSGEIIEMEIDGRVITIYPAFKDGSPVGYAVKASTTKGFSGLIVLMVGFLPDGTIYNSAVVSHLETPGLGDKMEQKKHNWSLQFNGKNPANYRLSVKKDGGDVDAITAATISSRAFCDAVELAYKAFLTVKPEAVNPEEGDEYE